MPKYLSGRVKKTPLDKISADRYKYIELSQTEPDLGDPNVGPSSMGANPIKSGQQYIIVAVDGYPGERFWIPNQGGIIPGSISVFDEGNLVGTLSSITQLNFKGAAVSATPYNTGFGATITIFSPGNNQELLFNNNNEFGTSSILKFNSSTGLLSAGDSITIGSATTIFTANSNGMTVGFGGTVITTTLSGLVGIGTTNPTQELDLNGDLRLRGTIYDYFNQPGTTTQLLIKNSLGGLIWVDQQTLRTGAGGTYRNIQYHNSAGIVDGASTFVYNEIDKRVGIGSTIPTVTLDVLGNSKFTGQTTVDYLNVTGVSTIATLGVTGLTTTQDLRVTRNFSVSGISTLGVTSTTDLTSQQLLVTGITTLGITTTTNLTTQQLRVSGISTLGVTTTTNLTAQQLRVSGISTLGITTISQLYVSGVSTFYNNVYVNKDVYVTGIATIDNININAVSYTHLTLPTKMFMLLVLPQLII